MYDSYTIEPLNFAFPKKRVEVIELQSVTEPADPFQKVW